MPITPANKTANMPIMALLAVFAPYIYVDINSIYLLICSVELVVTVLLEGGVETRDLALGTVYSMLGKDRTDWQ